MTSIQSLSWSLWQRNRKLALVVTALVLLFGVINSFYSLIRGASPWISIPFFLGVGLAYLMMIAAFMFHDADVGSKGSAFPPYMFTLPVRTYQLVLVPMLLGSVAAFLLGFVITGSTRLSGIDSMLYLPPMTMVAILAYLQAAFWYPVGIPYAKLVLTLVGITGIMIYVGVNVSEKSMLSEPGICQGLTLFTLACYLVAAIGVSKARQGVSTFTLLPTAIQSPDIETAPPVSKPVKWLPSFKSSATAQRWYEWRQHGMVMPTIILILVLLFYIPMYWNTTHSPITYFGELPGGKVPYVPTYLTTYLPLLLGIVPFVAWIVGSGARRSDVKHNDRTLMLFFGVRPMSDGGLVRDKLWAALKSTLVAWAIVAAGLIPVLFMSSGIYPSYRAMANLTDGAAEMAFTPNKYDLSLWQAIQPFVTGNGIFTILLGLLLMIGLTWRNYAVGYWTELSGKIWLRNGYPIALLFAIFTFWGVVTSNREFSQKLNNLSTVNNIIWAVIGIKLGVVLWLVLKNRALGILTSRALLRSLWQYLLGVGITIAIVLFLTKELRAAYVEYQTSTPLVTTAVFVGIVLIWVPIVRILLAPLMLHHNRHRSN